MTTTPTDTSSILIVDDMEENLVALEAVLGSLANVVRARSGEEALKAMLRQEFAVVLIDVLMPGMSGFETAANIKGLDQTKDVPVILLTGASVDPDYAYRGYTVGAADFLIKPFDPWLLRTKVNVFLDLHRKNRQLAAQAEQLRRLLTAENRPGGDTAPPPEAAEQPAEVPERPESTRPPEAPDFPEHPESPDHHQPTDQAPAGPHEHVAGRGAAAGDAARLAEAAGQLAQVELVLRETEGPEPGDIADRIAELEQAVGRLLARKGP
ncbi:response regulator [Streptomyces piniterrae]|uniref:Response regulator n=1 Tax=Streptomyces piniterrae TaxID=2571125 RepID=A0A4U0N9G6_9ACTN|nr:response regulator [Streptomyces piniterrae]TJZ50293.1 response regulator [Streptomyces piniterrae]